MNTVKNGFQLGRFIHHIFWGRDLTAIVQPCRDFELINLFFGHGKTFQRAFSGFNRSLGQHHGELRYALAMATGVRRLFINRIRNQLDERLK